MPWPETRPMKRGEVWWVAFDPAVGSEIRKTRPAVIGATTRPTVSRRGSWWCR